MSELPVQPKTEGCWKIIGVWAMAENRCPELDRVIHCRNCEYFTQAGRKLLERDYPEQYRNEWTDVMAVVKEEESYRTISCVIFRIEREWLALRTRVFSEMIDSEGLKTHTIPHRKNPVLIGLINIRGEIQLCVSLKTILNIESNSKNHIREAESGGKQRMMVMDSQGEKWVFPVRDIQGVYRIHPSSFQNVPVTVVKSDSTFTRGIFEWKNKHVAYLDDELLLFSLNRSVQLEH